MNTEDYILKCQQNNLNYDMNMFQKDKEAELKRIFNM